MFHQSVYVLPDEMMCIARFMGCALPTISTVSWLLFCKKKISGYHPCRLQPIPSSLHERLWA
jgi:hypothetical protein